MENVLNNNIRDERMDKLAEPTLAARRGRKSIVNVLPLALVRAREAVMLPFRNMLRRYGLTEPQFRVMRTVADFADIEMSDLARVAALLMPSLSRIVRELEQRGYMEKLADPVDMRRLHVRLTPRGHRLVECALPDAERIYAEIKKTMGVEKIRLLQGLLAELETKLGYARFSFDDDEEPAADVAAIVPPKARGRPPKRSAASPD
ncbi:MAG: MarR family transcriptional regulator [Rhizobiaceae bacterium]